MSSPQSQTISPPKITKKTGGLFSFDFISINACTFDGIEDVFIKKIQITPRKIIFHP